MVWFRIVANQARRLVVFLAHKRCAIKSLSNNLHGLYQIAILLSISINGVVFEPLLQIRQRVPSDILVKLEK